MRGAFSAVYRHDGELLHVPPADSIRAVNDTFSSERAIQTRAIDHVPDTGSAVSYRCQLLRSGIMRSTAIDTCARNFAVSSCGRAAERSKA